METVVATPPGGPLLSPATVATRLGIAGKDKYENLVAYIAAATQAIDGPEGWLGRALGIQTLRASGSNFPWFHGCADYGSYRHGAEYLARDAVKLLCPPIVSISSIAYVDADGVTQTLDPTTYRLSQPRTLYPVYGAFWPSSRIDADSVQITYVAGYPGGVPAPILAAIVMGVAKLNSMVRSDIALQQQTAIGIQSKTWGMSAELSDVYDRTAMALLAPYRVID